MSKPAKIVIIEGDGIGPEVTQQGARVLEWIAQKRGLDIELVKAAYGLQAHEKYGTLLPDETQGLLHEAKAILFGSVGGPGYEKITPADRKRDGLLSIRKRFDLFANLRPIRSWLPLHEVSSLKDRVLNGVDFIIVRELTGGIYFGQPRGIEEIGNGERQGTNTHTYTSSQIKRVAREAFKLAKTRRGEVCSVDKSNVMEAGALWRQEVQSVHDSEFPEVKLSHMLADSCAMQLSRAPSQFDVMLTDNLFGDLFSDAAAMISGSLGMLPSASIGPTAPNGGFAALYEPIHGSAPDIAGHGIANPIGSILSVAMLLRLSLGADEEAAAVETVVLKALRAGARTKDIALGTEAPIGTVGMGDAVLKELKTVWA
jgi:3-isopropylmalate dehydrogenase